MVFRMQSVAGSPSWSHSSSGHGWAAESPPAQKLPGSHASHSGGSSPSPGAIWTVPLGHASNGKHAPALFVVVVNPSMQDVHCWSWEALPVWFTNSPGSHVDQFSHSLALASSVNVPDAQPSHLRFDSGLPSSDTRVPGSHTRQGMQSPPLLNVPSAHGSLGTTPPPSGSGGPGSSGPPPGRAPPSFSAPASVATSSAMIGSPELLQSSSRLDWQASRASPRSSAESAVNFFDVDWNKVVRMGVIGWIAYPESLDQDCTTRSCKAFLFGRA